MERLKLPPRLAQIARWITPGRPMADVGTDHGYLPVWLRLQDLVPRAIASDLRPGPLERARETGRRFGVTGIDYRLCPGLRDIAPEEVETVVIAGMGAQTMCTILAAAPWLADGGHTLLLQPQTHEEMVRRYLSENGFVITRETVVWDRGLYIVLSARPGRETLTPEQMWAGAALEETPLSAHYRLEKRRRLEKALAGLCRAKRRQDHQIEMLQAAIAALGRKGEISQDANGA